MMVQPNFPQAEVAEVRCLEKGREATLHENQDFLSNNAITARVAIDFGSGAVKIQVALMDTKKNQMVGQPLLAKYVPLALTEDVASHNFHISEEMKRKALSILQEFKNDALSAISKNGNYSLQLTGVATAVFRKAENGAEILQEIEKKLGIPFQIIPQNEEGKLGFATARALYPEIPEEHLLAWDSGNGSFQMTLKKQDDHEVFQGPLGNGTIRVILSKDIRGGPVLHQNESGNPLTREEAVELAQRIQKMIPPTPQWLQQKLDSKKTVIATFGDGESIFALVAQAIAEKNEAVQEALIRREDVQKVIDAFIGRGDEALDTMGLHRRTLLSAIHLQAIMQHYDLHTVHYKRSVGSTSGMLLLPQLWEISPVIPPQPQKTAETIESSAIAYALPLADADTWLVVDLGHTATLGMSPSFD